MKRTLTNGILACLCALVAGCAANSNLPAMRGAATDAPAQPTGRAHGPWNVRDHIPLSRFTIQSHRGAGSLAPGNTLDAFELGWKMGTVPESDVRTTRDGVIVAFHDANFKRVVRNASPELQKKTVADLTFAQLSSLDVGSWRGNRFVGCKVPRMSEVFALMEGRPRRRLYMDIKRVKLDHLAREVHRYHVGAQVILASTHDDVIRRWKAIVPNGQTLLWMGGTQAALQRRIDRLRAKGFQGVTQLQIHIWKNKTPGSVEPFTLTRAFLRSTGDELRRHGILYQALPWQGRNPQLYWHLMDLGFASFATDYPDVTLHAVRDYYAGKDR